MTISTENQKKLDNIATRKELVTQEDIENCISIWKDSHWKISTVFSFRWFKPDGMPDFMLALVDLHKNWNDYADANETIKQFIIDRQDNRRRSASTNNPESNSTRIMSALAQRVGLELAPSKKESLSFDTVQLTPAQIMKKRSPNQVRDGYHYSLLGGRPVLNPQTSRLLHPEFKRMAKEQREKQLDISPSSSR